MCIGMYCASAREEEESIEIIIMSQDQHDGSDGAKAQVEEKVKVESATLGARNINILLFSLGQAPPSKWMHPQRRSTGKGGQSYWFMYSASPFG